MRSFTWFPAGILAIVVATASPAQAATVAGTVSGPDSAPFRGAFVQARNAKTKITVSGLSDPQGRYRIETLPAGDYRLQVKAIGYKAEQKSGVALAADQNISHDIALQKASVRWSDLSMYQGKKLLPDGRGKDVYFLHCMACHGFQLRIG